MVRRRLLVPAQFTFFKMNKAIQIAFGWEDCHLFQFSPNGYGSVPVITEPLEDDDIHFGKEKFDAAKIKLVQVFTEPQQKFMYIYGLTMTDNVK